MKGLKHTHEHSASMWLVTLLAMLAQPACTGQIGTTGSNAGASGDKDADTNGDGDSDTSTSSDPTSPGDPTAEQPTDTPLENDPTAVAAACAAKNGVLDVGRTRLRRMTRDQFNNTVSDLIGATGEPASAITPDERIGPFFSNAIKPIDSLTVEQHQEVAARLAKEAQARMDEIAPCDLSADAEGDCATQFIEDFGLRAYRRPLDSDEVEKYLSLYQLGQEASGVEHGFALVVEAMLQSPFFLYHLDVGETGTPSATPVPLTGYELASRLSYFLWSSMPDEELFAVASSGTLADEAVLTAEVDRMLQDSKASHTLAQFHQQWLALGDLPERDKDLEAFPNYTDELAQAMLAETSMFADYVIRQGDSLLSTLLTADFSFPQGGLFDLYGISEPDDFSIGTRVGLDATQRAGILTQPAFLARHAHRDQTSPVHRGMIIRENVLCQTIDPPPPNVNNAPPQASASSSTRERFAQHSADPVCAQCHELMDPIGLGFENFDAVGAWRTEDGLGAVDATGSFEQVAADLAGEFDGAVELASKLASSSEVRSCFANQWFRFALGRTESNSDACSVQSIHEGFEESGGNIRLLMSEIAKSEAFLHVRASGSEEAGQ